MTTDAPTTPEQSGHTNEGHEIVQYRLLGSLEVERDGEVVDVGGYKQRALMALLLINANKVVSTDRVIDELWEDGDAKKRQNALWVGISRLRGALEPDRPKRSDGTILVTQPPGYVLTIDTEDLDATRFEALATEGRSLLETDPTSASLVLGEALALWRGHALEEFTYEPFAGPEIERLEEMRLAAVEDRIDADLRSGRSRELVGELESLVRQHPLRQRLVGHLMLALHLSGRQSDALRTFGAAKDHLADELGLDPSPALSKLEERIVLDDPTLSASYATRSLTGRAEPGLTVRGYELREQIGEGATGTVHRAFQPSVGREVAIKVIRPELANEPNFIRRFEAEAQLIASLEHPQIVPVFDYWREPDSAYLVMRSFEHGNLTEALERGPLATDAAVQILSHIGGALRAAHRRGVVHGDVRPENILIDDDGNAYLAGFGISTGASDAPSDDPFVAPEQHTTGPTERSDQFAFAAVARAALSGAVGGDGLLDAPLVGPPAEIIDNALAVDPDDRFPDVAAFLEAMAAAFDEPVVDHDDVGDLDNPYRGLRAFSERDAGAFYGRERTVERLVNRLGDTGPRGGFVALVGPSGSGKSSVVQAGLVPAMRDGAIAGSERWFVVSMTPGSHPFEALDDALRSVAVRPPGNLLEQLTTGGLAGAVRSLTADPSAQTVIVVDQFEELFSQGSAPDAEAFMRALAEVVNDRASGIKIVITLRADFYDHPLRHETFGELLRVGTEVITPMNAQELERAITAPAAELGVSFESGLVALITADMVRQSTALPLLQYALTELFDRRSGRVITAEAYEEVGGISAALARRADALYEGLDDDQRAALRHVFLRLVTLEEGSADTRRRALISELTDVAGEDVSRVVEHFGRHRLLSFDRDPITRSPTVEIAHEALLTEWSRLTHWIDDVRADVQAQRRLSHHARDWEERDRDADFLFSGSRLSPFTGWVEAPPVRLTSLERDFLTASHAAADSERNEEQQRIRRLRRLVTAVGVALVVALVAAGLAIDQRQRAVEAATEADLAALTSRSAAARVDDPTLALLLALEANERESGTESRQALLGAMSASSISSRIDSPTPLVDDCTGIMLFPPGFRQGIGFAGVDGRLLGLETATGEIIDYGPQPGQCALGFRTETDGMAGRLDDGSQIWVGPNWEIELDFDSPTFPALLTGDHFATVSTDESGSALTIYETATGTPIGARVLGGFARDQTSSADEALMAVAFGSPNDETSGSIAIVELATGDEVARIDEANAPSALVFEPDGHRLVAGLRGGEVLTIDGDTGEVLQRTRTDAVVGYIAMGFLPDGRLVGATRGAINLIDRENDEVATAIELSNVTVAVVRPDGLIVTVGDQGETNVYDLATSPLVEQHWAADSFSWVSIVDGRAAIVDRPAEALEVVDLADGSRASFELRTETGELFDPKAMYAEPDGVWAMNADLFLGRWEDGVMVDVLDVGSTPGAAWVPYGNHPSGERFGDRYAVLGLLPDGTREATLVQLDRGNPTIVFRVDDVDGWWAHPTADGGMFVIDFDGLLHTYDEAGQLVGEPIDTGAENPYGVTLSSDGTTLAMGSLGASTVIVVEVASDEVHAVPVNGLVSTLGITPDGSQLTLAMFDGSVRLYDVEERTVPTVVWNGTGAFSSAPGWYDDSTSSMWIHSGGQLLSIPLDPDRWVESACQIVGRDLTQQEWDRLVPGEEPLRSACA